MTIKKTIIRSIVGIASVFTVSIILLLHNAWGDERYELKVDAVQKEKALIRKEIGVINRELALLGQDIIFSDSENHTKKYQAQQAIYENDKKVLEEELEDKG